MPLYEIPVAMIINDTVLIDAPSPQAALAIVEQAAGADDVRDKRKFLAGHFDRWHVGDVDFIQRTGAAEETATQ